MPNWVYTYLDITGKEEDLREFIDKAKQPYATHHTGGFEVGEDGAKVFNPELVVEGVSDEPLSFWNFKKPTDLEAYFSNTRERPENWEEMSIEEKVAHDMKFEGNGWYSWNCREWGTKWDTCESELMDNSSVKDGHISYKFDTAWSPAEGAFQAMIEQHPNLHFSFHCEEEQGWGVEYESSNGNLSVVKEWDIPDSHADYVERDNVDSCLCSYNDDRSEWFDDCPEYEEAK